MVDVPVERPGPARRRSAAIACAAATATLLNRQKPIARSRSAWWPGGRSAQNASARARRRAARSAAAAAPPAACSAASKEPGAGDRVDVDHPAAARAERLDRVDVGVACGRGRAARGSPPAPRPARARPARAPSSAASIARRRAAFSGCGPVSCSREEWVSSRGPSAGYRTRPVWIPDRSRASTPRAPTWSSSAAAPPGLHVALEAAERGRPGGARLAQAARRELELLGPGRPRRGARAPTTRPSATPRTRSPPGAGCCRTRRGRGADRARPRPRSRSCARAGSRFDRERRRRALRSGSRAGTRAPDRPCRRQRDRRARSRRRLAELVAAEPEDRGARGRSALALWSDGERCARRDHRRGRSHGAGDRAGHRRRRRAVERGRPTRAARSAPARCSPTPPAPSSPTSSSASSTPRRWRCPASEYDGLADHRGGPRRGRDAARRRRRAVHRRARAARRRSRAAILDRMEADGADHVLLDLRGVDPDRFPNVFATCREPGSTRRASPSRSRPPPTT